MIAVDDPAVSPGPRLRWRSLVARISVVGCLAASCQASVLQSTPTSTLPAASSRENAGTPPTRPALGSALMERQDSIRSCMRRQPFPPPGLLQVRFRFTIGVDGRVLGDPMVLMPNDLPLFSQCFVDLLRTLQFPQQPAPATTVLRFDVRLD